MAAVKKWIMFDRTRVESETTPCGYYKNCSNVCSELSRGKRAVPRQSRHLWTKMVSSQFVSLCVCFLLCSYHVISIIFSVLLIIIFSDKIVYNYLFLVF